VIKQKIFIIFFAILFTILFIIQIVSAQNYPVPLQGKKIAVFLDPQYQIDEAWYAPKRLTEAGADVKIVSHHPVISRDFHTIKTDINPEEALKTRWDGIVVVGGFSPLEIREDKNVINIIRDVNNRNGMVSAICHGVCVLVTADLIRGKNVTGNIPRSIEFKNAGAIFHDTAPQIDGNIITAIGPQDNGPYLDAMINWFDGGEKAAKDHLNDQYLKGKRIAVIIDNRYNYDQVKYPMVRLHHNGADVYYLANAEGEYSEYRGGGKIKADMRAQDAFTEKFDAVILISHWAADTFRRHPDILQFVSRKLKDGTLIASINWGHTALISADICKGYKIASTWGMQNDIKNAGGTPVLEPVCQDRNLITCATDDDMPLLMRYVVGYLTKK